MPKKTTYGQLRNEYPFHYLHVMGRSTPIKPGDNVSRRAKFQLVTAERAELTPDDRRALIAEEYARFPHMTKKMLVDYLEEACPNVSRGGHRGLIQRLFPDKPWRTVQHTCPKCKNITISADKLADEHGYRQGHRLQSYCGSCR